MAQLVSLQPIRTTTSEMRTKLAEGKSGCHSSSCGSEQGSGDLSPEVWEKVKNHPCYSEEAHHYYARMHVAVAPACNIQCNYCNRKYDCANESRPGVVSERLTPEQALRKVRAVAARVPQLSVLGVAGPGDACYDFARTRATFEMVKRDIPELTLCLSTNGLSLPDHVDTIAAMGIDHVTITLNAVDPEIGQHIYAWVYHRNRRWTGKEAATILLERQLQGMEMLKERGILIKINSVLIPGINDHHLQEVNRVVKAAGAFLHNVMPLISDPAHGTRFGLDGQRGPTPAELSAVQEQLEGGAKLMRHCRQCRADAVGLLGEDRGQEFMLDQLADEEPLDLSAREEYQSIVERTRAERAEAGAAAAAEVADANPAEGPRLVAVATRGGGRINQHFGHAREVQVFEVSTAGIRFIGHRKLETYCEGGFGDDTSLDGIIAALAGVDVVLCAKVGDCPQSALRAAGIQVSDAQAHEWIEEGIGHWYAAERARSATLCA